MGSCFKSVNRFRETGAEQRCMSIPIAIIDQVKVALGHFAICAFDVIYCD